MGNILNILFCFLLCYSIGNAQSIKRSVICSFGSSNSNATTNISTTLGQPSNIGSVTDGFSYIRQGFQQPLGCVGGPISVTTNPTICDGDSIVVGSSVYFLSGLYSDTLLTLAGCDSIIITNLSVNQQANTGTANPLSLINLTLNFTNLTGPKYLRSVNLGSGFLYVIDVSQSNGFLLTENLPR